MRPGGRCKHHRITRARLKEVLLLTTAMKDGYHDGYLHDPLVICIVYMMYINIVFKESLSNRHDWCILWAYSLLNLSLVGLSFPWIFCSFVSPLETKQNQRKSKENCRIHPAQNQRKTKNIKGNQRKPKETKANQRILYPAVKNAWSSDVTNALLWHCYMNGSLVLLCVVNFHST